MQAVRAERAVQTMTQIMPRAGLLAVVAAVRRRVVVVLVAQGGHGAPREMDPTVVPSDEER